MNTSALGSAKRGRFITFEGIDGSGKSTQIAALAAALKGAGHEVVLTREPGGTPLAEKLRALILNDEMQVDTELLLFFAARAQHVAEVIKPALARGAWVISDRFTDATYAYQVGGKGVDASRCEAIEAWTLQGFRPDRTLLFDLPPAVAAARRSARAGAVDRFEAETAQFFARVRAAYLDRAAAEPARFLVLNAELSPEQLTERILGDFKAWW